MTEALRQEPRPTLRVTEISPGMTANDFASKFGNEKIRATIAGSVEQFGISPDAIARGILYALEQQPEVKVGSVVIRLTA